MPQYTTVICRLLNHLILRIICRQMVFLIESGIGLMYFQMKDFQPSLRLSTALLQCLYEEVNRLKGTNSCLFCHTDCFNEDVLCNTEYDDAKWLEKFESALLLVVEYKMSHMSLND
ncbi:hypothetical protein Hanom_Chr07g00666831 [Helianthus anomalus]